MEIPVKKKYLASKRLYGYARVHSGNGRKKPKRSWAGISNPYDKRSHVLVLQTNMKKKFVHGSEAQILLGA